MFMKEMLLALRKAVDQALAADAPSEEIPLDEFPSHVVKSLEAIIADADAERATRRLATLQAELDEACALVKQGDGEQLIRVVVHEEPELTAKPRVEKELPVPYDSGTAGYRPAKGGAANAKLASMLAKLAGEVAALKEALAPVDAEQRKDANDQAEADQAKGKGKAKPPGAGDKMPPKPKSRTADAKDDKPDAAKPTKKSVAQGAARTPAEWADWPNDMNATMPGAEPERMDPDLDWGADSEEDR
jgi:hypothetical protein